MFSVPILYIVYNRPEETETSFKVLQELKPAKLYIAADGPRPDNESDRVNTNKVRDIVSSLNWPCEVKTLFSSSNLGCRRGVEKALDWFFTEEEEGIILEDDIIPNQAFFDYCQKMLERYRNDNAIFSVNGCSIGYRNEKEPHGLTRYFNMWGWATWKRSYQSVQETWQQFDPAVPLASDNTVKNALHLPVLKQSNIKWLSHWQKQFSDTYDGEIDTWDFQWFYTCLKKDKYCIRPSQNFVMNIGFNEAATHHKFTESPIRNLTYTADTYVDQPAFIPKVDPKYEIFNVGNLIHTLHLETWQDVLARVMPTQLKQWIKRNGLHTTIRSN
jgi:hypothetical protein